MPWRNLRVPVEKPEGTCGANLGWGRAKRKITDKRKKWKACFNKVLPGVLLCCGFTLYGLAPSVGTRLPYDLHCPLAWSKA